MNKLVLKDFKVNFYNDLMEYLTTMGYYYNKRRYYKKQILFLANSLCEKVGIILKGSITIEHDLQDGKKNIVSILHQYDMFGEILVFSNENTFPYNIVASDDTEIIFIQKTVFLQVLAENKAILSQFLNHLSKSYLRLNKYIKLVSQRTLINKLSYYLLNYKNINDANKVCHLTTKTELADFLGVERQSLIRELNRLKTLNILDYDKNCIYVKDYNYLKNHII